MSEIEGVDLSNKRWRIRADKSEFAAILEDPEFRAVVKIARASNAVLFCQMLLIETRGDGPQAQRVRMNAMLYLGPVLYEAMEAVRQIIGRDLRRYDGFKLFKEIFRDKEIEEFKERILKSVRNDGVFHFTSDAIPDGLAALDREHFDFSVGEGIKVGNVYHALADEAVVYGGFGAQGTQEQVAEQMRPLIKKAADLSAQFGQAAEQLIAEVLLEKGFYVHEESDLETEEEI